MYSKISKIKLFLKVLPSLYQVFILFYKFISCYQATEILFFFRHLCSGIVPRSRKYVKLKIKYHYRCNILLIIKFTFWEVEKIEKKCKQNSHENKMQMIPADMTRIRTMVIKYFWKYIFFQLICILYFINGNRKHTNNGCI